jgi:hypothetical protein
MSKEAFIMTNLRGRKTILFQYIAAAILVLLLHPGQAQVIDGKEAEIRKQAIKLGPGSAHPSIVTIYWGTDYPSSILLPVLPDLLPISGNPHDVGDHVGIYLQNKDPERKTR